MLDDAFPGDIHLGEILINDVLENKNGYYDMVVRTSYIYIYLDWNVRRT